MKSAKEVMAASPVKQTLIIVFIKYYIKSRKGIGSAFDIQVRPPEVV